MGVYIPPPSDSNNGKDNDKDKGKPTDKKTGNLGANGGNGQPSSSTDAVRQFIHAKLKYGVNPSFGLQTWGPLVPPPDNKVALQIATGLQFALACTLLVKSKNLRNSRLISYGITPSNSLKFKKWVYALMGTKFVYDTGMESLRFYVSSQYDPWEQERVYYKNSAIKDGKPVHWWFGPQNYTPMSIYQFTDQLEKAIVHRLEFGGTQGLFKVNDNVQQKMQPSRVFRTANVAKLINHDKFCQLYDNICEKNQVMYKDMLEQLKDTSELNKGERLDAYLEDKAKFKLRKSFTKPPIMLGTQRLETDDDLNYVWHHFEPWTELKVETDYDIRLVLKSSNLKDTDDD